MHASSLATSVAKRASSLVACVRTGCKGLCCKGWCRVSDWSCFEVALAALHLAGTSKGLQWATGVAVVRCNTLYITVAVREPVWLMGLRNSVNYRVTHQLANH
jgi:hypothetical protein